MGVFSKTFHKNFSERSGAEAERSGAGAERSGEKVFLKRFWSNTPIFCSEKVWIFYFERSDVLPFSAFLLSVHRNAHLETCGCWNYYNFGEINEIYYNFGEINENYYNFGEIIRKFFSFERTPKKRCSSNVVVAPKKQKNGRTWQKVGATKNSQTLKKPEIFWF